MLVSQVCFLKTDVSIVWLYLKPVAKHIYMTSYSSSIDLLEYTERISV